MLAIVHVTRFNSLISVSISWNEIFIAYFSPQEIKCTAITINKQKAHVIDIKCNTAPCNTCDFCTIYIQISTILPSYPSNLPSSRIFSLFQDRSSRVIAQILISVSILCEYCKLYIWHDRPIKLPKTWQLLFRWGNVLWNAYESDVM